MWKRPPIDAENGDLEFILKVVKVNQQQNGSLLLLTVFALSNIIIVIAIDAVVFF